MYSTLLNYQKLVVCFYLVFLFGYKVCFITDLFMDLSHKGGCRALHVHSHAWPRQILFNENVLKQRIKFLPRMIYSEIGIFFSELDFEKQEVW